MRRHEFLQAMHELTRPRTYVETGVHYGESLTLSRVPSIGIDPDFSIRRELLGDMQLARTTSDEFFARARPLAHLPTTVIDLAFIDGMHLAEYALRDYLALERFTAATSVVVFDDMLPRSIDEAARHRHTGPWTGDIYKAAQALRDFCPELIVLEVDTTPTGLVVVLAPDASRGGVLPQYDAWLDVALEPDPQRVPDEVLRRTRALDPERLLASPGWRQLPMLRRRRRGVDRAAVRAAFADVVG
ncbi:class I SAM-dependent methyltransferase [uncultured Jatrophihabitans sp.]|uniref:class I SAM-dependent methyltransferase n=1 Tax=uncultured Jatrophihabitans sp. TaxID=1610747 RepID=UPI0035CB7F5A